MTFFRTAHLSAALALIILTLPAISQTFRAVDAAPLIASNAIARADFNHDGFLDLVSVNNTGSVSVLLSDHEGGFVRVDSPGGCCPLGLPTAADMNGDRNPDVLVIDSVDLDQIDIRLLLGNGDGTLQPSRLVLSLPNIASMAVADLDRDGKRDLVVFYNITGSGRVLIMFGDGTGRFPRKRETSLASLRIEATPVLNDIDNDGDTDIFLPCFFVSDNRSAIVILRNNGVAEFKLDFLENTESGAVLSSGDVNQDNVADLLISSHRTITGQPSEGLLSILFNPGLSATRIATALPPLFDSTLFGNYQKAVEADFDNDGYHDIAFPVQAAPRNFPGGPDPSFYAIAFSRQRADGSFTAPRLTRVSAGTGSLVQGDFNNDGLADLAYSDFDGSVVALINTSPVLPCEAGLGGGRGVHVCSPFPGAVDSPVHVLASPKSGQTIQAMKVYVDGTSQFATTEDAISTRLNLSPGTHRVTVKAWDNAGAFGSTLNINVGRGSACSVPTDRTVVICSPSVGNEGLLRVLAGLRSSLGIETAQVYLDHQLSYIAPPGRYYVDVTFIVPIGSHVVTVKGWDKNGSFSRSANFIVH